MQRCHLSQDTALLVYAATWGPLIWLLGFVVRSWSLKGEYLVAFSLEFWQQLVQQQHLARGLHQQVQL